MGWYSGEGPGRGRSSPMPLLVVPNVTAHPLIHWPLMGGLLHLVQQGGAWASYGPAQAPPRCTNPSMASVPITVLL